MDNNLYTVIKEINEIIYMVRTQDYTGAKNHLKRLYAIMDNDPSLISELVENYGSENVTAVLGQMNSVMESGDMILLADLIEGNFMPAVSGILSGTFSPITESGYIIEPTTSGFLTVKCIRTGKYLHSNNDPVSEARLAIDKVFSTGTEQYAVWGAGLGYQVEYLFKKSEGTLKICVYDDDIHMIEVARRYGVYSDLPSENVSLIHDPNGKKFIKDVSTGDRGIYMHIPSLEKIPNKEVYDVLWGFFLKWNGYHQLKDKLAINFRVNVKNCKRNVSELRSAFEGKEIVIVAGGPSLDDNVEFLRSSHDNNRVIVSVMTVLKRLTEYGVIPDFAVVMDAKEEVYIQMYGLENEDRPGLIIGSTSYWKFSEQYKGEKYIAFQEGFKSAESAANAVNADTFATGHSVTTLALSIALKFGAMKIYLVGADMAYRDGMSHASGTTALHKSSDEEMIPVCGAGGDMVYTTHILNSYREWIESEIAKYPQIPVVNMSKTGARIQGTLKEN